jgi:hypothetical protein
MAFTTEQITALEIAISTGQLSVRFNGREIRYQSTSEMIRLRDRMRSELGLNNEKPLKKSKNAATMPAAVHRVCKAGLHLTPMPMLLHGH